MISRSALLGTIGTLLLTRHAAARSRRLQESDWLLFSLDEANGLNPDPFGRGAYRPQPAPPGPFGFVESWYVGEIPDQPFPIPVIDSRFIEPHWRP
jgi:hypothetical protein